MGVWECGSVEVRECGGAGVGGRNVRPVQHIIKCQGRKGEFGLPVRWVIISTLMNSENLLTALRGRLLLGESTPGVKKDTD